jgi:hypothetical protein
MNVAQSRYVSITPFFFEIGLPTVSRHRRSQSHAAPKPGSVVDWPCASDLLGARRHPPLKLRGPVCIAYFGIFRASRMHRHAVDPAPLDGQSAHYKIWSGYRCKPIVDTKSQDAARVRKLLHQRRGEHLFSSCSLRCHRIIAGLPTVLVVRRLWVFKSPSAAP